MGPFEQLLLDVNMRPGASPDTIAAVAKHMCVEFPSDYVDFMRTSNGYEGLLSQSYVVIWPIEELVGHNEGYLAREFYPGCVLIGSDGAGEAIAVRKMDGRIEVVLMPFIGGVPDALVGGNSLEEFLAAYCSGAIWHKRERS